MTVEFNPVVKSINIVNEDLTKITLEIKNRSLDGKYDDIRKLSGKTVSVIVVPEIYSFTIPYDKSVDKPTMEYKVFEDGTVELVKQEQTQLDIDEKGNIDIVQKTFSVDKEVIDEYILNAGSFSFPGEVNPREVLQQLAQGVSMSEIAAELEFSESALINELEKARRELAPFADAWKKANASGNVLPVEESTKLDEKDTEKEEKENAEIVTDSEESDTEETSETVEVGEDDGEGDPY